MGAIFSFQNPKRQESKMSSSNGNVNTSNTEQGTLRKEVEATLGSVKQVISKSIAPISSTPYAPRNDQDLTKMSGFLSDLRKLGFKDVETLFQLLTSEAKGYQDDNKFLLENLVGLLSKLDVNSKLSNQLTGAFIDNLWGSLPHPPLTSLGTKYKYREADGSYNNIRIPDLGAANTPYARSAKPSILQNIALPDPGVIFDSLMARGDTFEPHPNKISSMLFYLATIIIHDIFRTDHNDFNNSMTSSYLDLAPLYGSTQDEQDTVRTFKDGRLKPDCFSEKRILGFPPGVGVFVIMFNRFHNYVVTQLAAINESGRFPKPKDTDPNEKWVKYDNDLFQTGRLITCGLYVNCVLKDYVRTILSLNRTGTKWDLDPRTTEGKTLFNNPAAQGTGNQVSAEFNLIYRWHSAISPKDDKWTQDVYTKMFPGQKPEDVSLPQLLGALGAFEAKLPDDPLQRPFANLKRNPNGTFNDDELVTILESSISDVAGSFGANRVPKILKSVEILGIIQARSWNMASLNEFREFAGLTRHATFEDINPDAAVAEQLKNLYDHPDFVELYPGLVAEKAKPPMSPGSGLCVNFTTSYAILSDAVGLVRGDRFYTVDYTPKNLTNWGYNEVQYDTNVDDGAVLYKVILRAFPNHFKANSIYAHFPFVIPEENLSILKDLGRADKYSWDKPTRKPDVIAIESYEAVKAILADKTNFKVTSGETVKYETSQPKKANATDFALSGDSQANTASRTALQKGLYPKDWQLEVSKFYTETTAKFLNRYSYKIPGKPRTRQVDIVRDISNLVNTRFAASVFSLPLKTEETPHGVYTEQELYQVLALGFISTFYDNDVARSFQILEAARVLFKQLGDLVLLKTEAISATGFVADLVAKLHQKSELTEYGTHLIKRLLESQVPIQDVVWSQILPTAASMTANQAQVFSEALDYYLGEGKQYIPELYKLAHANTKEADDKILHYFLEAARLSTTLSISRSYQPSTSSSLKPYAVPSSTLTISPNASLLLDIAAASRDPAAFPSPDSVDSTRPLDVYLNYGFGGYECVGKEISFTAMTTMFKVVFGLKNLRRAEGSAVGGGWYGESQGEMKTVEVGRRKTYLTPDQGSCLALPSSMKVWWDEE